MNASGENESCGRQYFDIFIIHQLSISECLIISIWFQISRAEPCGFSSSTAAADTTEGAAGEADTEGASGGYGGHQRHGHSATAARRSRLR